MPMQSPAHADNGKYPKYEIALQTAATATRTLGQRSVADCDRHFGGCAATIGITRDPDKVMAADRGNTAPAKQAGGRQTLPFRQGVRMKHERIAISIGGA